MLSSNTLYKLQNIFSRYAEIKAVYLFGSRAIGKERSDSDLDLGVFTKGDIAASFKLKVLKDLTAEGFDRVDLVMLAKADPVVCHEAVRLNKLIYSTDDFDRGETYSNVIRKYLDLLPYLKKQREAYKQKKLYAET